MPLLTVSDFSCIEYLEFELAPVTVIIGPQGSGKSVTTKLFYFFSDIISRHYDFAERDESEEAFKNFLAKSFCQWFPPSAWGSARFNINFYAGDFHVRVLRRRSAGQLSDEVKISFSEWFSDQYAKSRKAYESARDVGNEDHLDYDREFEAIYRAQETILSSIDRHLESDLIASQTFIPAGRAFFTSLGRFIAGFEGGGHLDLVTLRFAKLYARLRDRGLNVNRRMRKDLGDDLSVRRAKFLKQMFGGELARENELEFVKSGDGRRIPFSALSSGQQELLPMWSVLDYFSQVDAIRNRSRQPRRKSQDLVYIEEPEAHLFPSAQGLLMEYLIATLTAEASSRSLILTTHSPYIMSKLNVFMKAGQLARRKKVNKQINEIVPRECWLDQAKVSAYALEDGKMRDIIDPEDGLIDGSYLDQISEDISREYSSLLALEVKI